MAASTISVRPFRPGTADDAGAKALEARASQHSHNILLTTVIKVHLEHLCDFDSKARGYDDSAVLLAVDAAGKGQPGAAEDGFICGCLCLGIKDVWLHGEVHKVGYLFDMRVHEDYQRRSVGTSLYRALEAELERRAVAAVYLTVNSTNHKARAFYAKNGYTLCSQRALAFTPLLVAGFQRARPLTGLRRASPEEMARIVDADGKADLALAGGFGHLLRSCPNKFLDSWVVEEPGQDGQEGSLAALTLWDGDGTSTISVERLLLTPATWRQRGVQESMLLVGCLALLRWSCSVWQSPFSVWTFMSGALLTAATVAGVLGAALVRFVSTRSRERARLVAPVAKGPRGVELLKELARHACLAAYQQGFAVTIANLDIRDSRLPAFSFSRPKAGKTHFMVKWLKPSKAAAASDGVFAADSFFDPRDLS